MEYTEEQKREALEWLEYRAMGSIFAFIVLDLLLKAEAELAVEHEAALVEAREADLLRSRLAALEARVKERDEQLVREVENRVRLEAALSEANKQLEWAQALIRAHSDARDAALSRKTSLDEAKEKVIADVSNYKQALQDHMSDPCQCGGICREDCGPRLAAKILNSLAALRSQEKEER